MSWQYVMTCCHGIAPGRGHAGTCQSLNRRRLNAPTNVPTVRPSGRITVSEISSCVELRPIITHNYSTLPRNIGIARRLRFTVSNNIAEAMKSGTGLEMLVQPVPLA